MVAVTRSQNRVFYAEDSDSGADDLTGAQAETAPAAETASAPHANTTISATGNAETGVGGGADTLPQKKEREGRKRYKQDSGKRVAVSPKKDFDHAKILMLPHDVFCAILSNLHPLDLYNLSISSRRFADFLHSRKSMSVWVAARKRLTVYVPRNFITAEDTHEAAGRTFQRLRHHPFERRTNLVNAAGENHPTHEEELEDEEMDELKLPLSIPEPPPGFSEFSLARYLFCNICQACGTIQYVRTKKVPDLMARFCKSCSFNYHHPLKTALLYFESKATSEKFAEVPLYYEFLLAQTYWSGTRQVEEDSTEGPVALAHRRIYTQPLEQDFIVYQKKRRALSGGDFEVWYQKKLVETEQRRTAAAKLAEYCWLKATYDCYIKRLAPRLDRRDKDRAEHEFFARVQRETDFSFLDLFLAAVMVSLTELPRYGSRWKSDPETTWQMLEPSTMKKLEPYARWAADNPFLRWIDVSLEFQDWLQGHASQPDQYLPDFKDFELGLLPELPRLSRVLDRIPRNSTGQEKLMLVRHELDENASLYQMEFASMVDIIRKDLVRTILRSREQAVDACDDMSTPRVCQLLDLSTTYFMCAKCQQPSISWLAAPGHPCFSGDRGTFTFLRVHGLRCRRDFYISKLIGWQAKRVRVDTISGDIHHHLFSVLEQGQITEDEDTESSTHSALLDTDYWFKCTFTGCKRRQSSVPFQKMVEHLARHIIKHGLTIDDMKSDFSPQVAEPDYASDTSSSSLSDNDSIADEENTGGTMATLRFSV